MYPTRIKMGTGRVFFSPADNTTDTWYFTTAIIIGYEQVKMYLFYYINYDLFWLLNSVISNICWILILNMCILCFTH
jgi:hypothetical protein